MQEFLLGAVATYIFFLLKTLFFGDYPGNPLGGGY